jgi:hypothetical protein
MEPQATEAAPRRAARTLAVSFPSGLRSRNGFSPSTGPSIRRALIF